MGAARGRCGGCASTQVDSIQILFTQRSRVFERQRAFVDEGIESSQNSDSGVHMGDSDLVAAELDRDSAFSRQIRTHTDSVDDASDIYSDASLGSVAACFLSA